MGHAYNVMPFGLNNAPAAMFSRIVIASIREYIH